MRLLRIVGGRWLSKTHGIGPTSSVSGFAAWRFGAVTRTSGRFIGRRYSKAFTGRDLTAYVSRGGRTGSRYTGAARKLF